MPKKENYIYVYILYVVSGIFFTKIFIYFNIVLKQMVIKLSDKRKTSYPIELCILRCRFSFAMMRSAIICLRGSRSLKPHNYDLSQKEALDTPATVVAEEARLC